jgi:Pvc16 N-terminal domain
VSNFLAIATVTEALRQFIIRSLSPEIAMAVHVNAQRPPTEPPTDPTITIFCYQVAPDPHLRNLDAPTRSADGTTLTRPQAALDLHYLISFYGDEVQLVPQRLLGVVVRSLYEQPILQAADIQAAMTAQSVLAASDLAAAPQRVRFTPTHMDLDDLYKLWTMMAQTQMALSLTYQATLVLIDGKAAAAAGRPVLSRTVRALPGGRPTIEQLLAQPPGDVPPADAPVGLDDTLVIQGYGLAAPGVWVRIADSDIRVDPAAPGTQIGDAELRLRLPDTVSPGVYPIQVLEDVQADKTTVLSKVLESNVMSFVRQARIAGPVTVTPGAIVTLAVPLDIAVRATQRVKLLLDELAPAAGQPARSYQVDAPFPLGSQATMKSITIAVPDVAAARYLVRVQVDGAQSPLEAGPGGFTGPVVTIPAGGGP